MDELKLKIKCFFMNLCRYFEQKSEKIDYIELPENCISVNFKKENELSTLQHLPEEKVDQTPVIERKGFKLLNGGKK